MWDILLLNCHPFFFLGYKGRDYDPLSISGTKKGKDITVIISVIGYPYVDDYFGYWIFWDTCWCDIVLFGFEYTLDFLDILVDILCILSCFTQVLLLVVSITGFVVPMLWFWVSKWPCMRVGWGLLVLICVVKGFVPELPNGEIVSV